MRALLPYRGAERERQLGVDMVRSPSHRRTAGVCAQSGAAGVDVHRTSRIATAVARQNGLGSTSILDEATATFPVAKGYPSGTPTFRIIS
jgi:hypothetical protein